MTYHPDDRYRAGFEAGVAFERARCVAKAQHTINAINDQEEKRKAKAMPLPSKAIGAREAAMAIKGRILSGSTSTNTSMRKNLPR